MTFDEYINKYWDFKQEDIDRNIDTINRNNVFNEDEYYSQFEDWELEVHGYKNKEQTNEYKFEWI